MTEHFTYKETVTKGKKRRVGVPDDEAREFHDGLTKKIRGNRSMRGIPEFRNRITALNVQPHVINRSNRYYLLDIENAYDNVALSSLVDVVVGKQVMGPNVHSTQVMEDLYEFCIDHETGGLIQGGPASWDLFDLYCEDLDDRLSAFSVGADFVYTRYADDLTFSARSKNAKHQPIAAGKRRSIRSFIEDKGFAVSHPKSHLYSLDEKPITITGISIYPDLRVSPTPQQLEDANEAVRRVKSKLERGVKPDKEEVARMNGFNSLSASLDYYLPDRKLKPGEANLLDDYAMVQKALKNPIAAAAMMPENRYVQGGLFDQPNE